MADRLRSAPCVVDNVALAMFVDAGYTSLLTALAAGSVFLTPSIVDPDECPPFADYPVSEFAKGLYEAQYDATDPIQTRRDQQRSAFYAAQADGLWHPVRLSADELSLAHELTLPAARAAARKKSPGYRTARVDPGEAECAAVAISRDWTLWSDDRAIVALVRALYPACRIERTCGLLVRGVDEGLIPCEEDRHLYNDVFKGELGLWTTLSVACVDGKAVCR